MAALVDLVFSIKWWGLARLMDAERADQLHSARVKQLLQEGEQAFASGDRRLAHETWREAVTADPYNEVVWLALLRVLEGEDDRVVCLENIIAINPLNVEARRLLRRELGQPEMPARARKPAPGPAPAPTKTAPRKASTLSPIPESREHPLTALVRGLGIGLGLGVLGVVIAVTITIVQMLA
ncbi:MAG: hypothetical protein IPK17_10365 [Chloroflexi bacterium]|uniref:tetratricopeptide repeat protein n=1 Tax=Candidatus Flexifilum breve TaxID=3140694 RepID=UPI003135B445|nr:hypothetical protein [Chloroflexota bacterium]